jgi:two-component system cell cycle response regulator
MTQSSAINRKQPRKRVLKRGIVAFNNRHSTLECAVRDLSDTGAKLMLEGSLSAPDTFELIVELDGVEADCVVVWRRGGELGVRFSGPTRHVSPLRKQVIAAAATAAKPSLRRKPVSRD